MRTWTILALACATSAVGALGCSSDSNPSDNAHIGDRTDDDKVIEPSSADCVALANCCRQLGEAAQSTCGDPRAFTNESVECTQSLHSLRSQGYCE